MTAVAVTQDPQLQARLDWEAQRSTFIGGSEVYELFSIPQYGKGCVRALAYRKSGQEPDIPVQMDEDLLERGNEMEEIVAAKYERDTGRKVRRGTRNDFGFPVVRRHPDYPGLGVHTDRYILAGTGDVRETGDLELKTHREGPFIRLLREGIPPGHSLQVQHSLLVTGHKWGAFAVLWPDGWKLKHFDIPRDEQVIDQIKRTGDHFWNTLAEGGLPDRLADEQDQRCKVCVYRITCRGEAIDEQEAAIVKANKEGKVKLVQITNPDLEQLVASRELLAQEIKAAEEQKEGLDEQIKATVREHGEAVLVGGYKVYCKPSVTKRVDLDALRKAEPEIAAKFTKSTSGEYYRIYPL